MKTYKFLAIALAASTVFAACSEIDEIAPQSGTLLSNQLQETNSVIPSRVDATFTGMYYQTGEVLHVRFSSSRPDNFGFPCIDFSNDIEAADIVMADSGYNWFSTCGQLTSRNADYANPYIRYKTPYDIISVANDVIAAYPADTEDPVILQKIAQAKAMRAYCYLRLAPYFQFRYVDNKDKPCVPIVTEETTDFTNNPRASVAEVYEQILADLNYAVENLEGYTRPNKSYIDINVAHGLRARAYLNMEEWQKAYDDAVAAAEGYTPATIAEVSVPSFKDINEHNWIWGYDMTTEESNRYPFATSSSWIRSFSGYGYAPATQCYSRINTLLYKKIENTDVRKGWWVDDNLESPLLEGLKWPGFDDVANADDGGDSKLPYLPYTNVKFGCNSVGTENNDEDWPYMRVEEMILIQAECLARLDKATDAVNVLNGFVKTYRNPDYFAANGLSGQNLCDEIWRQRRIELWGEGFANSDTRRLGKPLVRFHAGDTDSNVPAKFKFNLTADDGWWLMRFCTDEMNTNKGIVDNTDGIAPVENQNGELRDGVTD